MCYSPMLTMQSDFKIISYFLWLVVVVKVVDLQNAYTHPLFSVINIITMITKVPIGISKPLIFNKKQTHRRRILVE